MNIFVLHRNPVNAARMHCDKHIGKMTIETAQLLSYVHRIRNPKYAERNNLYALSKSHASHPCTLWMLEDSRNYRWTYRLLKALLAEYDYRYEGLAKGKYQRIQDMRLSLARLPRGYDSDEDGDPPHFVLAMNKAPECVGECAVESYRRFYIVDKRKFASWRNRRPPPKWWVSGLKQYAKHRDITQVAVTKG